MSQTTSPPTRTAGFSIKILAMGFVAGFLAVPLGHQIMELIYYLTLPSRKFPWNMAPNPASFGLPSVVNLSFWGGVWGVMWALVEPYAPRGWLYWISAIVFGGVCATAVGAYVVTALKHLPPGGMSWLGFGVNGAWGLAAAFFLDQMRARF